MLKRPLISAVPLILVLAAAGFAQQVPAPEALPARVDAFGDALPDGAQTRLGTLRWRHAAPVVFVGYADNDKQLITVSQDGAAHVWDTTTGKELRQFGKKNAKPGNAVQQMVINGNVNVMQMRAIVANAVTATALAPDGKVLAVCSQAGVITLWDIAAGKEIRSLKPATAVYITGLCFSPDGASLVSRGNDHFLRIFNVRVGIEIGKVGQPIEGSKRTYMIGGPSPGLAFSPDGKVLVAGVLEVEKNRHVALVKRWEIETKKELPVIRGPQQPSSTLALSLDGKVAAWNGNDGFLRIWDLAAGKELHKLGGPQQGGYAAAMAFSGDGKFLATRGNDQIVRLWDVAAGKQRHQLGGPDQMMFNGFNRFQGYGISNLAFTADGKSLAYGTNGNTIRQWDTAAGKERERTPGHHGAVVTLAVSADGKVAATRGGNNTIHVWDAATGKERHHFVLPSGTSQVVFAANGQTLAASTLDGTVRAWDVSAGKEIRQWKATQPNRFGQVGLSGLALSPDGKTAATRGYDATIRLWDVAAGRENRQIAEVPNRGNANGNVMVFIGGAGGFNANVPNLAFSPDGTTLAAFSGGQRIFVGNLGGVMQPNADDNALQLWDVATGKSVRKFPTGNLSVAGYSFAPDGRTLAIATHDGRLTLWEVASGKERFQINNTGNLAALAYSPDARMLLGAGGDSVVRLWSTSSGKLLHQLKGHQEPIIALAVADNGKTLLSGSTDTTALVWDIGSLAPEQHPVQELNSAALEAHWQQLASEDAKAAFAAVTLLATAPRQVVPAFADRIKPMTPPDPAKVTQLIADLNSNQFQTRQKANDELEKLGELIEPTLKQVLAGQPTLEMRVRVERLLERLVTNQAPPAEELRMLRALEVLEMLRTPEARAVLEKLSKGAAGSRLTRHAQGSLRRLPK